MVLAAGTAFTGCGQPAVRTYRVTGTVTFRGKPVPSGVVAFHNVDLVSPMAKGMIQPDGTYELTTFRPGDGAPPGECKVTVAATEPGPATETRDPKSLVPLKYLVLSETPLTATVRPEDNVIDLSLVP
jgi:hypothetical protein